MNIKPLAIAMSQRYTKSARKNLGVKLATTAFLSLTLAGCLGTQTKINPEVAYQYQPLHSPALNLMLASGTMVEDGEVVDIEVQRPEGAGEQAITYHSNRESADNFHDTLSMISGGMVLSGAWAPPIGVSSGFHGSMMLLSLLDSPYVPSFLQNHFVAFMPSDLAPSEKEAAIRLNYMLSDALTQSLPQGFGYEMFAHDWKPTFGSETTSYIGVLTGGECSKSQVEFTGPGEQPIYSGCELTFTAKSDPVMIKAPDWMETEQAYLFHPDLYKDRGSNKGLIQYGLSAEPVGVDGILASIEAEKQIKNNLGDQFGEQLLLKVTEQMPAWFYVYIAPTKQDPVPKIYQQGQVLYFAKYAE
ncbi:hypothetical protein MAQ5080_03303 [Marinomonas aquimarina]|uniref:Uncharacterized protein n=1 Tax=Marinomonas aquimarina TaxID=295068 RepID=A0A1A8TPQ7_9GAMM|nr:hypothetical protein [Marinomonas aquimarina]SBS35898.1 hypothetical protein MAQ5080_03303 [Marinomonas aquimarina]